MSANVLNIIEIYILYLLLNYLEVVDTLVESDDDVDTELEVDTLDEVDTELEVETLKSN